MFWCLLFDKMVLNACQHDTLGVAGMIMQCEIPSGLGSRSWIAVLALLSCVYTLITLQAPHMLSPIGLRLRHQLAYLPDLQQIRKNENGVATLLGTKGSWSHTQPFCKAALNCP